MNYLIILQKLSNFIFEAELDWFGLAGLALVDLHINRFLKLTVQVKKFFFTDKYCCFVCF